MPRTGALKLSTTGLVACLAALVVLLTWHNNPASAQSNTAATGTTITVNTAIDESDNEGDCSLREP